MGHLRQFLSNCQIPPSFVAVFRSNIPVIGVLIKYLETGNTTLLLQRELTWIIVNLCCLPDDLCMEINANYNLLRVLIQTISRCNETQKYQYQQYPGGT
mmetsp:Transcript_25499/g.24814  ORF Transcript_25499/g.24814 Transcript_25499/m.24814 type:complete len:99 (+) Transcript_25499:339-635(+)